MANSINTTLIGTGTTLNLPINNGTTNQIYVTNTSTTNQTIFNNKQGQAVLEIPNSEAPIIKITGDIEWNGENLQDRLERIETMLNIPTRDVIMEEKYEKLRNLSNQYKQALEEYKTWERLKNSK